MTSGTYINWLAVLKHFLKQVDPSEQRVVVSVNLVGDGGLEDRGERNDQRQTN